MCENCQKQLISGRSFKGQSVNKHGVWQEGSSLAPQKKHQRNTLLDHKRVPENTDTVFPAYKNGCGTLNEKGSW